MKKLLLGSSMLAVVAFAASAQADTPKITVGGVIDWQVGIMSDDQDANQRAHAFRNDTEINFNVDGKTDAGLGYGAVIVLEADVTNDVDAQGTNAAETYIYLDGSWGRVQLGSAVGASGALKVDAASIARATGGIDGDWYYFANNAVTTAGGVGAATFLTSPDLPLAYGIQAGGFGNEAQENTNKVTYFTPRWSGFQAGISYAPNDADSGQTINRADNRTGVTNDGLTFSRAENIVSGGVNYQGAWDQVGIEAAATMERGSAETAGAADLFAWNVGAKLSYMGFSVAGSYGDWDDSLSNGVNNDESYYWTLGGAYEFGPYGVSATYLKSQMERGAVGVENEFDNLSIGADYKLAPGLTPYAEISFYDADANGTAADNNGHVFLLGTMLNF